MNAAPARARPAGPLPAQVRTPAPTLAAAFGDPDGDRGRVHFRLCRAAAPAGSACVAHVASGTSAFVSSGAIARWRAPRLADGTYHWQVRSEDGPAAQSGWSRTRRLVVAARLVRVLSDARQRCDVGSFVTVRLKLAMDAHLSAVLVARGRRDVRLDFGRVGAGTRTARIHLRWSLERRVVYRIAFVARRRGETGRATVAVRVDPIAPRTLPRGCDTA